MEASALRVEAADRPNDAWRERTGWLGAADSYWSPECVYLDTASYGLPPQPATEALDRILDDWRHGRANASHWCEATEQSRQLFARLVHVDEGRVAVGSAVSPFVGTIAASLPRGRVVAADIEFSSLLWPWIANGHEIRTAPLSRLSEAIDAMTDVVVVSAVQSLTGEVAELDAIAAAAHAHGAKMIVDATHGCGWLPLAASGFDAVVCSAYKWLLSPRGTAFLVINEELAQLTRPILANWYAAGGALGSYFGLPPAAVPTAARFDLSPVWFSWAGTAPALEVLLGIGIERIYGHDVALANRFRSGLGLQPSNSAIVTTEVASAEEKLSNAGVRALVRGGTLRAAFHVYNDEADVDAALEALLH